MTGLRRPRLWAHIASDAVTLIAAWLLLVPITVVYLTSDDTPAPHRISSVYSWWTTDRSFVYSDSGPTAPPHMVNGVRLGCGNTFSSGGREEQAAPVGPLACSQVELPRRAAGLCLLFTAVVGAVVARRLPRGADENRYRMSYAQRRALRRSQ